LDWSQTELGQRSNLSESTIRDFEKGRRVPAVNNLAAIRAALESTGVAFVEENADGPGVRLRKRQFLLTPVDPSHPAWAASTWKRAAWTVALSELEARRRVKLATIVAITPRRGQFLFGNPWESADLSACEERACPFALAYGQLANENGQSIE
jgi:transcriptional regulator with XRE-family HTH domain